MKVEVDRRPFCGGGWSGCDNYSGGHLCVRLPDHKPPHRCECGAKTASRAADPGEPR